MAEPLLSMTCSRTGCDGPTLAQCDECGASVCGQHAQLRGSLSRPWYSCGRCLADTSAPSAAPALAPPPQVAGPFAKVELPRKGKKTRQPWVREKHTHRPTTKVLATQVVELPKPTTPTRRKTSIPPQIPRGSEIRQLIDAQLLALRGADMRWYKAQLAEVAQMLWEGRTEDAFVHAVACASIKGAFHPAEDRASTEALILAVRERDLDNWRNRRRPPFPRDDAAPSAHPAGEREP